MRNEKHRFALFLALLLIAGFFLTSLLSYFVARNSVSEQISESTLPLTSNNIYSEIQHDLLKPVFIASLMAQDTFLRDWVLAGEGDSDAIVRYLKEIQDRYHTVTSFFVSEKSRRYYHSSGVLKIISENDPADAWYFRTRQIPSRDVYEINVDWDTADRSTLTVFVNYKVFDYSGKLVGVTGVGLALSEVTSMLENYQQRYGRRIFFVDREGAVTLHGGGLNGLKSLRDEPALQSIATQLLTSPSGSFEFTRDGKTVYLNSRLVPEFKWYLIVEQEEAATEARLLNTLLGNLAISVLLTVAVLFIVNLTIGSYQRRLETMASTDKLTGVLSRQVFDTLYDQTLKSARRHGHAISLLMFDVDHFKSLNDKHGHLAGDAGLRWVVQRARNIIREADSLCRWGGDEFLVLLPDCDLKQAVMLGERIRASLEQSPLAYNGQSIPLTVTIGVTQCDPLEEFGVALGEADGALMEAKRLGRNRVEAHAVIES